MKCFRDDNTEGYTKAQLDEMNEEYKRRLKLWKKPSLDPKHIAEQVCLWMDTKTAEETLSDPEINAAYRRQLDREAVELFNETDPKL